MMSINSSACLLVLSFLAKDIHCRGPESPASVRLERDLEYMGDGMDPNFWPVRGRRDDSHPEYANPFGTEEQPSFTRGGRKKEEETGVFWAGRGRSYEVNDIPEGYVDGLWPPRITANEFDNLTPLREDPSASNRLSVEEPGWIWLVRREPKPPRTQKFLEEENVLCGGKPNRNEKREILRQKLCHLKRKSNNLLREIPQAEQFWPVRGKKWNGGQAARVKKPTKLLPTSTDNEQFWPVRGKRENEPWRELKAFWPARERRSDGGSALKDQEDGPKPVSSSKEVT